VNQVVERVSSESNEENWREHVVRASKFAGSNSQYCRDHGLSYKTFSAHKVKLGFSKPKGRPKAFIEVKPKVSNTEKPIVRVESKKPLPDAKWLAEFVVTVLASQR
jgi:hypothetical protein